MRAATEPPSPIARLEAVGKDYPRGETSVHALSGVTLEIAEGELLAVMGASGSGKSTLLAILGCLDRPTSGEYRLGGERVSDLEDGALSRLRNRTIGFVFQSFHLIPELTVLENVETPLLYGDVPPSEWRARAARSLERVGLAHRADHRPPELSGGEAQRAAIARALVTEPRLLLADEPTGNLDSATGEEIADLITSLPEQGRTVVLVTHNEALAARARRVVRLKDGRVVSDDPVPGPPRPRPLPSGRPIARPLMSPRELLRLGLRSLLLHTLRSTLSILGVVFGVAAVTAMSSVGEGARREQVAQIGALGVDTVTLRARAAAPGSETGPGLSLRDAASVGRVVPDLRAVAPVRVATLTASAGSRQVDAVVVGTTPAYRDASRIALGSGRFVSDLDVSDGKRIAVLGAGIASALFPFGDARGPVRVGDDWFQVVGVLEGRAVARGRPGPIRALDVNRAIFVPLQALDRGSDPRPEGVDEIVFRVGDATLVSAAAAVARRVVERTSGGAAFDVVVPREILRQQERTQRIFNVVTGAIAAISLLVGGIGIMNIMLAGVAERTAEVGVRRALGATRRDIASQFLVESSLLTVAGGAVGAALGVVGSLLIQRFAAWPTALSPLMLLVALAMALAVGVGFGFYPAWRAAHLEPMEALRHE